MTGSGSTGGTASSELAEPVGSMLADAWRQPGFCVPNQETYPFQWLWDSCFHALIWNALGSDRGVAEVESLLGHQDKSGFVPHMTFWSEPDARADFWRRSNASCITQPPMYGHAIAELVRAGHAIADKTMDRAVRGLEHLLIDRERTPAGLIPVFHPWETGCDDSARWDAWLTDDQLDDGRADRVTFWRRRKAEFVAELRLSAEGGVIENPSFSVGSVGFNALVAWNARELITVAPAAAEALEDLVGILELAVSERWNGRTWVDDESTSGACETLDALLCTLIDPRDEAFDALVDPAAFGAPFGPRGVHLGEPSYEPEVYWRGPAWPQLTYLLIMAAHRAGRDTIAKKLSSMLIEGATVSGLAEYWNPETGRGLGAIPQTWAGLAVVVSPDQAGKV